MRTPVLVAIVVTIHALAVAGVMFIQGCGTPTGTPPPVAVEPPPAPVMPPKQEPVAAPVAKPVFRPPVPVEAAPSMAVPTEGKTYVVQNGDSLSKIAKRVGVSSRELAELNNIKDANKIRIGQKLVLPDGARALPAAAASAVKTEAKPKSAPVVVGAGSTYVVQSGDSLSRIASRHGIKLSELRAANNLKSDKILIGQKLTIPGAKSADAPPAADLPKPEKKKAKTEKPAAASEASPLPLPPPPAPAPAPVPAPAMAPVVAPPPAPVAAPMPPPPAPAVVSMPAAPQPSESITQDQPLDYVVQPGDTVESIAKLFIVGQDEILRINGLSDSSGVKPGMKLKIPPTTL